MSPIIQHSMATIRDFVKVGLDKDIPTLITDCEKTIKKLDEIIATQNYKLEALVQVTAFDVNIYE